MVAKIVRKKCCCADGLHNDGRIKIHPALIGLHLAAPDFAWMTSIEFMPEPTGSRVSELETGPDAEAKATVWHRGHRFTSITSQIAANGA